MRRRPAFRHVVLAVFGLAVLATVAVYLARRPSVPGRTILELDLEGSLLEQPSPDPFAALEGRRLALRDVIDALARARDDERVVGLVARLGGARLQLGHAQELRDAVRDFRARGKFAVAFADTFGEVGPTSLAYYVATAFDEIVMQPSGDLHLAGLLFETPFFKEALDKVGVRFRGDKRHEYKNALDVFTETKYTAAHREAMASIQASMLAQIVKGIAAGRRMGEGEVRALLDRGPFIGAEALSARLVDALAYRDEADARAKKRAGEGAKLLFLHRYLERAGGPHRGDKAVALVHAVGPIVRGPSRYHSLAGGRAVGAETVARAIRAAVRDRSVKAIVLRIDSPGGSYTGSDTIWRETERARAAGKPVIASMANVAASGGYFIAMSADRIVAEPGTLTGSIGVFAAKPVLAGLWEKIGIRFDHVQTGAHAGLYSLNRDFSPAEWVRLQGWLDRVYDDFISKVARGRRLEKARVHEVARGRIWTGEQAKARGLVDELGGIETALRAAKRAAGIPESEPVAVRIFPRPRPSPLARFAEYLGPEEPESSEEEETAIGAAVRAVRALRPLVRALGTAAASLDEMVLLAPTLLR